MQEYKKEKQNAHRLAIKMKYSLFTDDMMVENLLESTQKATRANKGICRFAEDKIIIQQSIVFTDTGNKQSENSIVYMKYLRINLTKDIKKSHTLETRKHY